MPKPTPANSEQPCFEHCLEELEAIVAQLEAGEKPLDESLALYEKGVAALKRCHEMLDKAEQRIRLLVRAPGGAPALQDAEIQPSAESGSPRNSAAVRAAAPATLPPPEDEDLIETEGETEIEPPDDTPAPAPTSEKRGSKPSSRRPGLF